MIWTQRIESDRWSFSAEKTRLFDAGFRFWDCINQLFSRLLEERQSQARDLEASKTPRRGSRRVSKRSLLASWYTSLAGENKHWLCTIKYLLNICFGLLLYFPRKVTLLSAKLCRWLRESDVDRKNKKLSLNRGSVVSVVTDANSIEPHAQLISNILGLRNNLLCHSSVCIVEWMQCFNTWVSIFFLRSLCLKLLLCWHHLNERMWASSNKT